MKKRKLIAAIQSVSAAALIVTSAGVSNAQNLAGTWTGSVTCNGQYIEPQPWPLTLNVTGSAAGQYTIAAHTPNGAGTGTINGTSVSFTLATLLNTARFNGIIVGN